MPCLCVVSVGSDLMHFLGWVSIHDTHHHMGVFKKKFVVGIFGCMDFWVVTSMTSGPDVADGWSAPGQDWTNRHHLVLTPRSEPRACAGHQRRRLSAPALGRMLLLQARQLPH